MRNILIPIPHREKELFAEKLKQIWLQPDIESARRFASFLIEQYKGRFPEAVECLVEELEDSLHFSIFLFLTKEKSVLQTFLKDLTEKYAEEHVLQVSFQAEMLTSAL